MKTKIRPITQTDLPVLQKIARITFKTTFDPYTAPDDMEKFLRESYAIDKLAAELNNPDSRFFFLEVDGETAGYLKVNVGDAQTERFKPNALEVERIYLLPQFQHHGLGNLLLDYAENLAVKEQKDYLWLGVYEKNLPAQSFYQKYGFVQEAAHIFQVGEDSQTDYLLAKRLK